MKKHSIVLIIGLLQVLLLHAQSLPFGQVAYCDDFDAAAFQHTTAVWDWRNSSPANWGAWIRTKPTVNPATFSFLNLPFPYRPLSNNYPNVQHLDKLTSPFDYEPADGWELVFKAFGGPSLAEAVENPTLVLYNRFKGILRVFVFLTLDQTGINNEAGVNMYFATSKGIASSLFGLIESPAHAVEGFNKSNQSYTLNTYNNTAGGEWLFADIPVAYDPCTCGFSQNPANPSGPLRPNIGEIQVQGSISSISNWTNTDATGAQEPAYSSTDYSSTASSADVIEKGTKFFKSTLAIGDEVNKQRARTSIVPQEDGSYFIKTSKPIKLPTWIKVLPYVGDVFSVLDALVTGGEAGGKEGTANTATPTQVTFSGSLSTSGTILPVGFFTPGSPHDAPVVVNPDPSKTPIYDHVLGVFNLLEHPVVEYTTYQPQSVYPSSYQCINTQTQPVVFVLPPIRQYRLKNPLRYVVNPASQLELIGLDYALEYKLGPNQANQVVDTTHFIGGSPYTPVLGLYGPVASLAPALGSQYASMNYRERLQNYGIDIAFWPKSNDSASHGVNDLSKITYTTGFIPAQCGSLQSVFLAVPDASTPTFSNYAYTPEFTLKVRAILRRTDAAADEKTEDVVFLVNYRVALEPTPGGLTYTINPHPSTQTPPYPPTLCIYLTHRVYMKDYRVTSFFSTQGNTAFFPLGSNGIPYDLVLENQTISTSQYAMNSITLRNVQYFSPGIPSPYPSNPPLMLPGPPIEIMAGRNIVIEPGSGGTLGDYSANLTIALPAIRFGGCDASPLVPPATYSQIEQVCTDINRYNPVLSMKPGNEPAPLPLPFTAAPNPFTDEIAFSFSLIHEDQVSLRVLDLAGRTVALLAEGERMDAGTQDLTLPGSGLAPGIYLAVLETSRGRQTLRVVKQ